MHGELPQTVDSYMAHIESDEFRQALSDLRALLRAEMPEAEEVISYGIPTFKMHSPVLHYGAFAKHCSLFLGYTTTEFEAELTGFKTSKGTIQFTPSKPIPQDLLLRMVRRRLEDHLERLAERKSRKRNR